MLKVIIDTNILIGASYDEFSFSWKVINLVLRGKIKAYASLKILKENELILEKAVKNKKDKDKINKFFSQVEIIKVKKHIKKVKWDPEDDKFLECAYASKANFIITSDSHLLEIEEFEKTKIVSPKQFWYEYQGIERDENQEWQEWFKNIMR